MAEDQTPLTRFLDELKRRRVVRVALMYIGAGFLVLQGAELLVEVFQLPSIALTTIGVVVVLGLPIAVALGWVFDASSDGAQRTQPADPADSQHDSGAAHPAWLPLPVLLAFAGLLAVGAVTGAAVQWLPASTPAPLDSQPAPPFAARLQVALPPGVVLAMDTDHPVLAVSPDGSLLVFVGDESGRRRLYVRTFTDSQARPITGTEGAGGPFFSPDGAWIGFFDGLMLKKVATAGGVPVSVHAATPTAVNRGAAWISDTTVIYASSANTSLERGLVSDARVGSMGDWEAVAPVDTPAAWPTAVPGGPHVVFTENAGGNSRDARVAIASMESGERRPLVNGGTSPRYSMTGHLLFTRGSTLHAVPFDSTPGEVTGPEQELLAGVMSEPNGAAHYSVGGAGVLAYVAGEAATAEQELVWIGRDGEVEATLHEGRAYMSPRLSPDGTRLAVTITEATNLDVWILDLARGPLSRVTSHPGEDFGPVWSPDGSILAFASEIGEDHGESGPGLAWLRESGERPEQLLRTPGKGRHDFPTSWSPDGRWLAFVAQRPDGTDYLALLPAAEPHEPVPLLETPAVEHSPRFSPDGRWIAYVSDETGREEVYVLPFEQPGRSVQISTDGGREPVWSKDGQELFYWSGDDFMAAKLGADPDLTADRPHLLFTGRFEKSKLGFQGANYDVSSDGRQFLMVRRKGPTSASVIEIVLNWPAVLLH